MLDFLLKLIGLRPLTAEEQDRWRRKKAAWKAKRDPLDYLEIVREDIQAFKTNDKFASSRLEMAKNYYNQAFEIYRAAVPMAVPDAFGPRYFRYDEIPSLLWTAQYWITNFDLNNEKTRSMMRCHATGYVYLFMGYMLTADEKRIAIPSDVKASYNEAMTYYACGEEGANFGGRIGIRSWIHVVPILNRAEKILVRHLERLG